MFKLKRLNVVRIVEDEISRDRLKLQGFKEIIEEKIEQKLAEGEENTPEKSAETPVDYDNMTADALRVIAKDKNINNYSNMKKDELIAALKAVDQTPESEEK